MMFWSLQCEASSDVEYMVEEQKPACDLCAVNKKFEKGCYSSVVSTP